MGLSVTMRTIRTNKHEGVRIHVYQGLFARLFHRPLAHGYAVKYPAPRRPGANWMYNMVFKGVCHGGSAPTLPDAINDALSFVRE